MLNLEYLDVEGLLLSVETLSASHTCHEVPAGMGAETSCRAGSDVTKSAGLRSICINRGQFRTRARGAASVAASGKVNDIGVLEMAIKAGFGGKLGSTPTHGNFSGAASGRDLRCGYVHCAKQIGQRISGSLYQHNFCFWRHGVGPLDV